MGLRASVAAQALRLHEAMAGCESFDHVSADLLARLAEFFHAETGSFRQMVCRDGALALRRHGSVGVPSRNHAAYVQNFYRLDPVAQSAADSDRGVSEAFPLSERVDFRFFTRGEYYNQFFRPIGIHHVLVLRVRGARDDEDIFFGFHRPRASRPFGAAEIARAHLILGGLTSTLRRLSFEERMAHCEEVLATLEAYGPDPHIALFDDRLGVLYASPGARAALDCSGNGSFYRRLRDACAAPALQATGSARMRLDDAEPAALLRRRRLDDGAVRFVLIAKPTATAYSDNARLLTLREREIAALAAAGLTNREAADKLSISVRTVENHLRSIYAKLEVSSRVQLLRRLS